MCFQNFQSFYDILVACVIKIRTLECQEFNLMSYFSRFRYILAKFKKLNGIINVIVLVILPQIPYHCQFEPVIAVSCRTRTSTNTLFIARTCIDSQKLKSNFMHDCQKKVKR
jgi:hypothetical protein